MGVGVIARFLALCDILATTIYIAFEWQVILGTLCVKRQDAALTVDFITLISVHIAIIPLMKITILHALTHMLYPPMPEL